MIDRFDGDYDFLSNFHMHPVTLDGVVYPSNEHAYQAAKTLDQAEREYVRTRTTPGLAKKAGRRNVTLRPDWDQVKLGVMEDLCRQKFQDPQLRKLLLATAPHDLVEGNWWNDTFWGVCNGRGENHLGQILMGIREEVSNENP